MIAGSRIEVICNDHDHTTTMMSQNAINNFIFVIGQWKCKTCKIFSSAPSTTLQNGRMLC